MLVPHLQGDDFHKYGVLGPGLELQKRDFGVDVLVVREIHVHHVPAVGSTAVQAVELCDVLERTGGDRQKDGVFSHMAAAHNQRKSTTCTCEAISKPCLVMSFTGQHLL